MDGRGNTEIWRQKICQRQFFNDVSLKMIDFIDVSSFFFFFFEIKRIRKFCSVRVICVEIKKNGNRAFSGNFLGRKTWNARLLPKYRAISRLKS